MARYYFRAIRTYLEEGGAVPETSFFYRVPAGEREERVRFLQTLRSLRSADLAAYCRETDIGELLEWCYDEGDGQDIELQLLAASVAAHAELPYIRAILLTPSVNDVVKAEAMRMLAERNHPFEYGVVLGDVYKSVTFAPLTVGRAAHAKFVAAYALCFARFSLFGEGNGEEYRIAAQAIYSLLHAAGALKAVKDAPSLACAIFLSVSASTLQKAQGAVQLLGAEPAAVAAILKAVRSARVQTEAAADDASADVQAPSAKEENQTGGDVPAGE